MADSPENTMVSREFMEMQVSMGRVETLISITRDDFTEHKAEDERNFGQLFRATREISHKLDTLPQVISECRDEMERDLHSEIKESYVSLADYRVFTTKIIWAIIGGTTVASIVVWFLNAFVLGGKAAGVG